MPHYQNAKIYTIRHKEDNSLIYVGSTTTSLCSRWAKHRYEAINGRMELPVYRKMRDLNDIDNWYIELYENFPCNNREELNKREGEIIRLIGSLNKQIAGRTDEEYRQDTKQQRKERNKLYHEKNKESRNENNRQYYEKNKEKINEHKREYGKLYRQNNKDKIEATRGEKVVCECGREIRLDSKQRHLKSKLHQDLMCSAKTTLKS